MYLSFSIYIIASIAAISNCEAEDNLSILSLSGSTAATHHLRRGQEEESMKQKAQRTLNLAGTGLFKTVSRVLEEDCCCCCCDNDNNTGDDTDVGDNNGDDTDVGDNNGDDTDVGDNNGDDTSADDTGADDNGADDTDGNSPPSGTISSPTPVPTISLNPTYVEKKLVASDGVAGDFFATQCAVTTDFAVIIASAANAAYLFRLDGTEVSKLTPDQFERDGGRDKAYSSPMHFSKFGELLNANRPEEDSLFGSSVSIDEKVVVGSQDGYFAIFSLEGIFERILECDDECQAFGFSVATYGDMIATRKTTLDRKDFLGIYTSAGDLVKEIPVEDMEDVFGGILSIDISAQYIVTTGYITTVYLNEAPDFPEISRFINAGFRFERTARDSYILPKVAVAGDKLIVGEYVQNNNDGGAWLYKIDGTLVTELDRQDSASGSMFGRAIGITDEKVFVSAPMDGDGSIFVYSAATGDFIEKMVSPDGVAGGFFGSCMDVSDNSDIIGAAAEGSFTGAAYIKNLAS